VGEIGGWDTLICGYSWCYKICRTNVRKVVIVEILGNEYDFLWIVWFNGSCGSVCLNDFNAVRWFYLWHLSYVNEGVISF